MAHARYGVDLSEAHDTYVEPFVAYRAWNWTAEGLTSLNGAIWTPQVAFEAKCEYRDDWKSLLASGTTDKDRKWLLSKEHHVPNSNCTCGMHAGINMRHLIDINYIRRGIHGEVYLWGRLYRHTHGWRAQFAYPKYFVVPVCMIPFDMTAAQKQLASLTEFGVDIYLQKEREAKVGQERIPLWVKDYGYSQQGLSWLVDKRKQWYGNKVIPPLVVGDRVAVFSDINGGGIGVVAQIDGDEICYTLFNQNVIYRKAAKEIVWNERNWRWETSGLGVMRKLEQSVLR